MILQPCFAILRHPRSTGRTHSFLGDSRRTLLLRIQYFRNFGRGRNDGTEINATNLIFFSKTAKRSAVFRKKQQPVRKEMKKDHQRRTAPSECRRVCPHAQNARDGRTRQYTEPEQCRFLLPNMRRFRRRTAAAVRHNGDSPSREIHKTALGAENTVAWQYFESTAEAVESLRREGYVALAVEQAEGAVMLEDFRPGAGQRYALVFGNEVEGWHRRWPTCATVPSRYPRRERNTP